MMEMTAAKRIGLSNESSRFALTPLSAVIRNSRMKLRIGPTIGSR
jgi:hypothetical protein